MIQALFWDNDGVLVDTEHLYFQSTQEALAAEHIPLSEGDFREYFLVQAVGVWHLLTERGFSPAEIERIRATRNAIYADRLASAPLAIEGVASVLDALHGKYPMGIVTSSRRDHFEIIHRNTGFLRYFDFVVTADECANSKPHPEPYLKALERSGLSAGACLAIEDSARGLTAAKAAGMQCAVVPTGLTVGSDFSAADHVFASIAELLPMLHRQ